MKRLLLAAFSVLVIAGGLFAATVGQGTIAVSPSTALTGDNFVWNTFTTTYTSVTPIVRGIVYGKYPKMVWGTAASKVVVTAGVDANVGPIMTWDNGADYFYGVSVTAFSTGNTLNFAWSVTVPATAAAYAFTWYEANYSKTPVPSTQEIPAKVTITVASSNNCFTWTTIYPDPATTPFVLSTDLTNIVYKCAFTKASSGGELRINLNPGQSNGPFAQTVPNPLTWVAQALSGTKNNRICVNAQAGVFASPTCNGTQCIVPILTAAAGETVEIILGPNATTTPSANFAGTQYTDGVGLIVKSNALFPAESVTPQAMPTTFNNIKGNVGLIVRVPTPTIVLTVTANIDGSYTCYGTGYKGSAKTVSFGSQWKGAIDTGSTSGYVNTSNDMLYGAYTVTLLDRWQDVLNDGTYITTTATTTLSIVPKNFDLLSGIANGIVNKDYFVQSVAAAGPMNVTIFASAQAILKIDCWSNSACSFSRVVNGSANTINAIFIPALATAGSFGAISSPYTIPAAAVSQWYNNTAGTVTVNGIIYRIALPTR
jgi:hypothetical protein